ncbi:MAG: BREX-1 system adenine-specific DNA-methyltransferase PglX, partial [Clostridia bacterium]|nr:BREX-1 system adenine-specific DNA-methyltransferase PglX [Clostridia bacterium]
MDKNAIKKFAIWARRELISRVSQRAAWYGITEKDPIDEKLQAVHGHVLTPEEQAQRQALIGHIRKNGYQQVMEEVAYTWFNRFIALRFMEVNGYLPSYTRVFSDENGAFNPQILKDAIHLELEGLDMEKVYALEEANETEALFKYLVITQCNDLNRMLPGMFQKISDYTELLFPDFLLREGSVAHQMVTTIPEDDWKDAVQIIGWLYQYYNTEPNEVVYDGNMSKNRIPKELVPAATTIYTPDWTVRYMVENSLGRFWVAGHPNDELKAKWKYYLQEGLQEPEVEEQLKKIRAGYAQIDPASILCVDPCMGSGHILVYMFDVLMQIYLAYGYTVNEAVESIVRNNLWGMDIDDRAAQMAYFAVMMKAQQYDHRWLAKQVRHSVQPKVFALQDSGDWPTFERQMQQAFTHHPSLMEEASIKTAKTLFETFADAKEYGSIIQPEISLEELNMLESTLD